MSAEDIVTKIALAVTPVFKFRYNTIDMNIIKTMPPILKDMILEHQQKPNLKMLIELHKKIVELTGNNRYLEKGQVIPINAHNFDWINLQNELEAITNKYNTVEAPRVSIQKKTKAPMSSFIAIPGALDPNSLKTELTSTTKAIDKSVKDVKEILTPSPKAAPSGM